MCGTSTASSAEAEVAQHVGRLLCAHGAVVVCGGGGGVMAAVARGAAAAGGICVGLLPGADPELASPEVSLALPTGMGEMRNALIARMCRAMIAIGGGYGTLSEIGFMLRLGRPVCGLGTWRLGRPNTTESDDGIHVAAGAEEAVDWILSRA